MTVAPSDTSKTVYDTKGQNTGQFQAHGRVRFQVLDKHIIRYDIEGPLNEELISAVDALENNSLIKIKTEIGDWYELVVYQQSCIMTADSLVQLGDHLIAMAAKQLAPVGSVHVIPPDIEGYLIMETNFAKCYRGAGVRFASFENEDDALNWIQQQINTSK